MTEGSPEIEIQTLLRAGRIEDAAHCLASLSDRADERDLWTLTLELCEAVAGQVCAHKRMSGYRADAAAAAIFEVVRHVHSYGWNDAKAILKCAVRAASREAEMQRRYRNRFSASVGPLVEGSLGAELDSDDLGRDLARVWKVALAQLDAVHPNHAAQVRGRLAKRRLPGRNATEALRAAFVHVCEREGQGKIEEVQVGLLRAVEVIARQGGGRSTVFSRFMKFMIAARL